MIKIKKSLCNTRKSYFSHDTQVKGKCNLATTLLCLLCNTQENICLNTKKTMQLQCALKGFRRSKKKIKGQERKAHAHVVYNWLLKAFVIVPKKERHYNRDRQKKEGIVYYYKCNNRVIRKNYGGIAGGGGGGGGGNNSIRIWEEAKVKAKTKMRQKVCLLIWQQHNIIFLFYFLCLHRLIVNRIMYKY